MRYAIRSNRFESPYEANQATWAQSASGIYAPMETLRARQRPTGIDLFCGAGGFSLGFMQAGFEVLAALDNDPVCMQTYLSNLGAYPVNIHFVTPEDKDRAEREIQRELERSRKRTGMYVMPVSGNAWIGHHPEIPGVGHFWLGDVRKVKGQEMLDALGMEQGQIDVVFGGPPCQGFSISGKRHIMDSRNSLIFEFARLVLEIQPKTMVMENVPGILSMVTPEGLPVVDAFCRILEDGGFGTVEALKRGLLSSAGCGAALKTKRRSKDERIEEDEQLVLLKE